MSRNTPKNKDKNIINKISPEELGRIYTLGDSEVIAKGIIDNIVQIVTNQISLNHIYTLERS